jgi:hypothetical protein
MFARRMNQTEIAVYFPKYWAKAQLSATQGRPRFDVVAWGWSDISKDDALTQANVRAQANLTRLSTDKGKRDEYYQDGNRPFREQILATTRQGDIELIITRNALGCEVLNTDRVMFADIDYDPPRVSFFEGLFGNRNKRAELRAAWETQYLERLRSWQSSNSAWRFRVYRTSGGLRLLATSKISNAGSNESALWLDAVGSDPLYKNLCLTQKSFRARLTPKPWRCGYKQPKVRFPFETEAAATKIAKWLEGYEEKSKGFAVCHFLEDVGFGSPLPELNAAITFHDNRTGVGSSLPLA